MSAYISNTSGPVANQTANCGSDLTKGTRYVAFDENEFLPKSIATTEDTGGCSE